MVTEPPVRSTVQKRSRRFFLKSVAGVPRAPSFSSRRAVEECPFSFHLMIGRIKFLISRLRERLWIRPLTACLFSLLAVFLVKAADHEGFAGVVPSLSPEMIETLLKIIASSMLVIATFAVGSMVNSYASASTTATPRSFPLIVSDDVSQNALSSYIGAFIFSIVALIALLNGYYGVGGLFALFCLTLVVFAVVIVTFVQWVDCIARLGRLGNTITKLEGATAKAFTERQQAPTLGGVPAGSPPEEGRNIFSDIVGYVQRVDVTKLQECGERGDFRVRVTALPGTFATPGQPLVSVMEKNGKTGELDEAGLIAAFEIGDDRTFIEDPRFGLIALAEIASRALSPAVNDPGTAIDIIGTFVRLFVLWGKPVEEAQTVPCRCDRVEVPELCLQDLFDDAFTSIARDGAGAVEVGIRLQKAFHALIAIGDPEMAEAAKIQSARALSRAETALTLPEDLSAIRKWSDAVCTK